MGWLVTIIIGGVCGWLAGMLMDSKKNSLLINIILGVVGGFVAGLIFGLLGIGAGGYIGTFIVSTIGACALIWVWKNVLKK